MAALEQAEFEDRADGFARELVARAKLTPEALARARQACRETGERLEHVLTRLGLMGERDLAEAMAAHLGLPVVGLSDLPVMPLLEEALKRSFLHDKLVLPLQERDDAVVVAMVHPLDDFACEAVRFAAGKPVARTVITPADFEIGYARLYGEGKSEIRRIAEESADAGEAFGDDVDRLKDVASEAPVVRLVNHLITRAVELRASDIHIEPMGAELRIRYRIDGVLQPVESPPPHLAPLVISRIKIMAKLNIAERRLGQDGRIGIAVRGKDIDMRIATTPTIHGESVVLRILDRAGLDLSFGALGFEDGQIAAFRALIGEPHGIVLVTGPTGSGKTTTLYSALLELNTPQKKILTIEDPVEYQLAGINQVQVKPQIGLSFANVLRSFLRHDPDIMMIGEIRDLETAEIAVQAALTGHLILSTLHTNDAASALTRLMDMGVEDYLLSSTINGVAAQRLVRTLCRHCREPYRPVEELVERIGLRPFAAGDIVLHRAVGCEHCNRTGFRGRNSIVEIMPLAGELRRAVLKRADAESLGALAVQSGMQTMRVHGLKKALAGETTVEEVLRATRSV
ncbi:MAG: type II secretion system ATPase GspE [Alphaproteobacteria bacterium]|nr:type II secretion system ATPase GspE [Alphaproteobacteria bacterium]